MCRCWWTPWLLRADNGWDARNHKLQANPIGRISQCRDSARHSREKTKVAKRVLKDRSSDPWTSLKSLFSVAKPKQITRCATESATGSTEWGRTRLLFRNEQEIE